MTQRRIRDRAVGADLLEYVTAVRSDVDPIEELIRVIAHLVPGATIRLPPAPLSGATDAADRTSPASARDPRVAFLTTHPGLLSERSLRLTAGIRVGSFGVTIVIEESRAGVRVNATAALAVSWRAVSAFHPPSRCDGSHPPARPRGGSPCLV